MAQTTANTKVFVFGSGKFEVGPNVGALDDLGSLREAVFTETWDNVEIETDNAGIPIQKIKNQRATLKAGLLELELDKFFAVRGGIDKSDPVAGVIVDDYMQIVATGNWAYNVFIECVHQNSDLSILQIDATGAATVTGSVDGLLTDQLDYDMVKDAGSGKWGVIVKDSVAVTTLVQELTISYDYTPAAARVFSSGGLYTITPQVARLTHTDEAGKILRLTIFKASIGGGFEFAFPPDNSDNVVVVPFEMVGVLDTTLVKGYQLYEIHDTRAYA